MERVNQIILRNAINIFDNIIILVFARQRQLCLIVLSISMYTLLARYDFIYLMITMYT